jgi:hypothetical protein
MLDVGCSILDAGCSMPDARYWMLDAGPGVLGTSWFTRSSIQIIFSQSRYAKIFQGCFLNTSINGENSATFDKIAIEIQELAFCQKI